MAMSSGIRPTKSIRGIPCIQTKTILPRSFRKAIVIGDAPVEFCDIITKKQRSIADVFTGNIEYMITHNFIPDYLIVWNPNMIDANHGIIAELIKQKQQHMKNIFVNNRFLQLEKDNIQFFDQSKLVILDRIILDSPHLYPIQQINQQYSMRNEFISLCAALNLRMNDIYLASASVIPPMLTAFIQSYDINKFRIYSKHRHDPAIYRDLSEWQRPVVLIQQFFVHEQRRRQKEIVHCLRQNANNSAIDEIILLNERIYSQDELGVSAEEGKRIRQINVKQRLTYKCVLEYIRDNLAGKIVIFSNSDIYLDDTIRAVHSLDLKNVFVALLRWEQQPSGELRPYGPVDNSQDTWIIDGNINFEIDDGFNFQFGKPGCDNVITTKMLRKKFTIANPAASIRTIHVHQTAIRNYTLADTVPESVYVCPEPNSLAEFELITNLHDNMVTKVEEKFKSFSRKYPEYEGEIKTHMNYVGKNFGMKTPEEDNPNLFESRYVPNIYELKKVTIGENGIMYTNDKIYNLDGMQEIGQLRVVAPTMIHSQCVNLIQKTWASTEANERTTGGRGILGVTGENYHLLIEQLTRLLWIRKHYNGDIPRNKLHYLVKNAESFLRFLEVIGIKAYIFDPLWIRKIQRVGEEFIYTILFDNRIRMIKGKTEEEVANKINEFFDSLDQNVVVLINYDKSNNYFMHRCIFMTSWQRDVPAKETIDLLMDATTPKATEMLENTGDDPTMRKILIFRDEYFGNNNATGAGSTNLWDEYQNVVIQTLGEEFVEQYVEFIDPYDYLEQEIIEKVQTARALVSYHNDILTYGVFAPQDCRIIEINFEGTPSFRFWHLFAAANRPYSLLPVKREPLERQLIVAINHLRTHITRFNIAPLDLLKSLESTSQ